MGLIKEFFANRVLFAAVLGWLCAQVLKLIITACMTKKVNVERLWGAGGMPSAHSAMVCALTISVARFYGVSDPLFALAVMFAFVTMYDAMGVRRETGEQAKVLNRMISDWLSEDEDAPAYLAQNGRKLKEKVGHTPFEVLSGALLGILIAVIVPAP